MFASRLQTLSRLLIGRAGQRVGEVQRLQGPFERMTWEGIYSRLVLRACGFDSVCRMYSVWLSTVYTRFVSLPCGSVRQ